VILVAGFSFSVAAVKQPAANTAAERGRKALYERCFSPPILPVKAYENAWKQWGLKEKPADYDRLFRERYGLATPPYANDGLPIGLRIGKGPLGKGLSNDCLLCHAGSIAGETVIGLGNASVDFQSLSDDLAAGVGVKNFLPFTGSHVRGTIEAEAAVLYLMQFRDADLNVQLPITLSYRTNLCQDIPPWWHLKKKKTMFHTGTVDTRSIRANMPFLLNPLNSGEFIKKQEPVFRDIRAFLLTLEPPRYPFAVDQARAARGKKLFIQNCAKCHGTYGPDGKYPNKVVALDVIGTDATLFKGYSSESWAHYRKSWFNQERGPDGKPYWKEEDPGYQAPPLDGIWATAPYFHNGSVPTIYHVLNSKARPKIYTRSYRTGKKDYDPAKLGWKITVLPKPADPKLPAFERRKIYDTTQPGRGNGGHTFGDKLSEAERLAVIEYLKTL
jgi:mono/diheme cytochrome c family protein